MRSVVLAAAAALGALACNLISNDVGQFALRFPRHDFRIDTGDWQIAGGAQVPAVPCSAGCADARASLCGAPSCSTDCDGATGTCQLHVDLLLKNDYNLAAEAPELQSVANQPVITVTIDDVFFDVTENTMTVPTPTLYVYFGPPGAAAATDAGVELVGIIDSVPARTTGRFDVRFDGSGRDAMKRFMQSFHDPFRVLVGGRTTVHAGEPVPAGRLVGSVQADAHAGI